MALNIRRIDKGLIKIKKALEDMARNPSYVKIGLVGKSNKRPKGELSNAQLGIIHEFGTSIHPARPFIRPAFEKGKAEYLKMLIAGTKKAIHDERERERTLNLIGLKAAADMKAFVATNQVKPPSGGEGKTTLVDTGRMVGAITHLVVKKGAK